MSVVSLKTISAEYINSMLSEDAKLILFGETYTPVVVELNDIFIMFIIKNLYDSDHFKAFIRRFSGLLCKSTVICNSKMFIRGIEIGFVNHDHTPLFDVGELVSISCKYSNVSINEDLLNYISDGVVYNSSKFGFCKRKDIDEYLRHYFKYESCKVPLFGTPNVIPQ
jgi:hypothetical protein